MRKTYRMLRKAALILLLTSPVPAQTAMYEPARGSAERAALMNAIRKYDTGRDQRLSGEKFSVLALRVQGTWAFAAVEQLPDRAVSYGVAHVFLRKVNGGWRVEFSSYNDQQKVGIDGLNLMRKKYRSFPRQLGDFAMSRVAG